jgi:aromatic ring-cleaving dioxygenase
MVGCEPRTVLVSMGRTLVRFDIHLLAVAFRLGVFKISVLVHPNTDDAYRDHTELASWMGNPWPLNTDILRRSARH